MSDIEKIAAGLSEEQKRVLVGAPETVDGRVLVPSFLGNLNHADGWPRELITYYSAYYVALSSIGLALRNHLRAQENGNG